MKQNKYLKEEFKIFFRYIGRYKRDLTILSALGVVSALAGGTIPYIMGHFFDALLRPFTLSLSAATDTASPIFLIMVLLIVQIAMALADWQARLRRGILREVIYGDYIYGAYSVLYELPLSFHKNRKMGNILQQCNRAANQLGDMTVRVMLELAPQFLSIGVGLVFAFYVNYILALVLIASVLFFIVILARVLNPMTQIYGAAQRIDSKAAGEAHDAVANIQAVKAAATEHYEMRRIFQNFRLRSVAAWSKAMAVWNMVDFSQRSIIILTQLAIFILSLVNIRFGTMTVGELLMFNGYAAMFFGPFARVGDWWQAVQSGLIALRRAEEILQQPKEVYVPKNAQLLTELREGIIFQNVGFVYGRKDNKILDGMDFTIGAGEKVAFVGGSGEGKSTIVDIISGYYFPQKGKVLLDGHNLKNLDLRALRGLIAAVPQEVALFNDTIKKNIAYGKFSATDLEIEAAAREAGAHEFIEAFPKKYGQIVGERGVKLSVGQKQRIAIARAILRDPKILILDEPTSALDAKSEKYITESLEKLMEGRTTIIIAHRLSTVRKADKILVLKGGKIVEQGKHDELIRIDNGIYRELYELQVGLHE